jgi:NADPH:quinone reductase-like Zn-dependent oxidoreductase
MKASLRVLKPGGQLISISGPPDAAFARSLGDGGQLTEITSLIDEGIIRPVVDRVFPFASTKEAMAYAEAGRAKGKVVVSLR